MIGEIYWRIRDVNNTIFENERKFQKGKCEKHFFMRRKKKNKKMKNTDVKIEHWNQDFRKTRKVWKVFSIRKKEHILGINTGKFWDENLCYSFTIRKFHWKKPKWKTKNENFDVLKNVI